MSYTGESQEKELITQKDIELQDLGFENQRLHSELERENEKVLQYKSKIDALEAEIRALTRELEEQKKKNECKRLSSLSLNITQTTNFISEILKFYHEMIVKNNKIKANGGNDMGRFMKFGNGTVRVIF